MDCPRCGEPIDLQNPECAGCGVGISVANEEEAAPKNPLTFVMLALLALACGIAVGIYLFALSPTVNESRLDNGRLDNGFDLATDAQVDAHRVPPLPGYATNPHATWPTDALELPLPEPMSESMLDALRSLLIRYESIFRWSIEYSAEMLGVEVSQLWGDEPSAALEAAPTPHMRSLPYLIFLDDSVGSVIRAGGFTVRDFFGQPIVAIHFLPIFPTHAINEAPASLTRVYFYEDGAFVHRFTLYEPTFYADAAQRLIILERSNSHAVFYYMDSLDTGLGLHLISQQPYETAAERDNFYRNLDFLNPILPGSDGNRLSLLRAQTSGDDIVRQEMARHFNPDWFEFATPTDLTDLPWAEYFVLPESGWRLIELEEILHLNRDELRIARNEIFARHGRRFDDDVLQAHFDAMPWYYPTLRFGEEPLLSDTEGRNITLIQERESSIR